MKYNLLAIAIVISSLQTIAQKTSDSLSLNISQAIALAKERNFTILNQRLSTEEAKKQINLYRADGLPQVNFSSGLTRNLKIPIQIFPNFINDALPPGVPQGPEFIRAAFGVDWQFSNFAGLDQILFDGQWLVALEASKEVVTMSKRMEELTERQVEELIMKSYYLCLLTEQSIYQTEINIERIKANLKDLKAYADEGFIEKLEVDRLELNLSQFEINKRRYENQHLAAINQLKVLLGMNTAAPIKLVDRLEDLSMDIITDASSMENAIKSRPEYKVQTQSILLQELNLKRWKRGYLPTLNATANYQFNSFALANDFSKLGTFYDGYAVGAVMRWNIFDGLRKKSQIDMTKISIQREKNKLNELTLDFEREIINARNNYQRSIDDLQNARKNQELAGRIRDNTFTKYTEGVGSNFEYTTAENDFAQAQISLLIAIYNALSAEIEYKKALGTKLYN